MSPDSEATLVNMPLDLQIIICTLLHPSDILALRETCKTLQLPTRQRVVWLAALYQVCLENSLFSPSFPILDMSDVELEHAAMAPRRWIQLCGAASKKQRPNDPGASCATLRPRTTRIIEDSLATADQPGLFIVPGGRYMVSDSFNGIFIWDLGYTSSADCKLIASVGLEGGPIDELDEKHFCMIQATPDGTGLIIFSSRPYKHCSVYEIYPQSASPQLTRIAHLDIDPYEDPWAYLSPDRVFWYSFYDDSILFTVWDYRMNHSITFVAADIDLDGLKFDFKIIPTTTAIIILCLDEILIWAIPPLLPQPPNFFDDNFPIHIPPLFGIALPDGIQACHTEFVGWQPMSHWYCGSSQPLCFNFLCCQDAKLHRFEIIVKPDLFDTSLHLINTELVPDNFRGVNFGFGTYGICEDTLVAYCENYDSKQFGVYTWSRFTTMRDGGPAAKELLPPTASGYNYFLCPASGRYVHLDSDVDGIFVVDVL